MRRHLLPAARLGALLALGSLTLGALALASSALPSPALGQRGDEPFTRDERRRLLAGELVRRDVTRSEGRAQLFGGTSWQRVEAPVEQVWALVRDPATYPRLIPSLERVRVVEDRDGVRLVAMHHAFGVGTADYYARMTVDEPARTIRFALDRSRPRDVESGRGFVTVTPYRGGAIVAWGMLADVGAGMLQQLFGSFLNDWLLKPPRCVRDEVEPGRVNEC